MLNWDRVGLIVFIFIPALWQGQSVNPTLLSQNLWDVCGFISVLRFGRFERGFDCGSKIPGGPTSPVVKENHAWFFADHVVMDGDDC